MENQDQIVRLLTEIRDNQKLQLERQGEALEMQREQLALVQKQMTRAEKIQDRAELLQDKGNQMVQTARKAMMIILPVIFLLVVYLSWLLFGYLF